MELETSRSKSKQPQPTPVVAMSAKLYVGNLPFSATESDVMELFSQHGTVSDAVLMMDKITQKPRGFAFVTMGTPEEATKAAEALNGFSFMGRALRVNEARPMTDRPPRSFDREGGGGGGGGRGGYGGGGGGYGGGGGGGGGRRYGGGGGRGGGGGGGGGGDYRRY
jgi:cold-inducible RNA-binding protein